MRGAGVLVAIVMLLSARVYAQDAGRLELSEPPQRETVRGPLGWVQVSGRVATGEVVPCDVVIALDASESAFLPSGEDVDGDGVTGAPSRRGMFRSNGSRRATQAWTTDPGDTVFELSRGLARELIGELSSDDTRVGLLTFSEETRVRARLGHPERARRALDALRIPSDPRATHLESAIRVGHDLLEPWKKDGRPKLLIVLSDGRATRPGAPLLADRAALRAARAAARAGISIYSVAVGPDAAGEGSAYADLAALTDGAFASTGEFDSLSAYLPGASAAISLAQVEIANDTTGDPARAVRFFRDGSFDGFVRLVPGPNHLWIQAHAADGTLFGMMRTVYFDPAKTGSTRLAALRDALRARAIEIEYATLAQRGAPRKRVEVAAQD